MIKEQKLSWAMKTFENIRRFSDELNIQFNKLIHELMKQGSIIAFTIIEKTKLRLRTSYYQKMDHIMGESYYAHDDF